jgi:hypothetical protein
MHTKLRKQEGKRPLGDLGADGGTILKWMLKKKEVRRCIGFVWLRIGSSSGLL